MRDVSLKSLWDIYRAARELPNDQRRAYVESATPDPERVREILELLEASGSGLSAPLAGRRAGSRAGMRLGRYLTGELIGRGGVGEVYAARDTELDRSVALKFLSGTGLGTGTIAERFIREAKAASALNHPNIVTIYTQRDTRAGKWLVNLYDPERGSERAICSFDRPPTRWSGTLAVSADERWLVLPINERAGSNLVLHTEANL
jgi:hypothetical protein